MKKEMHNCFLVLPEPRRAINYNNILDIYHDEEHQKIIITLDEKFNHRVITIAQESNPKSYDFMQTWFFVNGQFSSRN